MWVLKVLISEMNAPSMKTLIRRHLTNEHLILFSLVYRHNFKHLNLNKYMYINL
jgi:hypothetical protein